MDRRSIARLILSAGLAAGPAAAAVAVIYETQGEAVFAFDAPDGWTVRPGVSAGAAQMPDGARPMARVITLHPDDEDRVMWAGLWSPPNLRSVASVEDYVAALDLGLFDDPAIRSVEPATIGGRPARVVRGDGSRGGRSLGFSIAAVQISPERVAVAAFIGEPAAEGRWRATLAEVLRSVRPAGAAR